MMVRFEFTLDQAKRIASPDQRAKSGIVFVDDVPLANPYILYESDLGSVGSEPVALENLDHGLRPEGNTAFFRDDDEVSH